MNKVFENKLDIICDRAMIPDTVGVAFCAVSFKLILIAEFFVSRCNPSVQSSLNGVGSKKSSLCPVLLTGIRLAFSGVCLGRQLEGCARGVAGKGGGKAWPVVNLCGRAMPDLGEATSALLGVGVPNSEDGGTNDVCVEFLCPDSFPELYSFERHESLPLL